tara:strand:- start:688 stop:999 length:312 start_codon:yes stop_codon:yes gene_type:complete
MKKKALISIFILILTTSLVKNSTKEIEDKIFSKNESIRLLNSKFGDEMLEYNYLSSPEKLTKHQSQYFNKDLIEIDITKIKKIIINKDNLEIVNFIKSTKINE